MLSSATLLPSLEPLVNTASPVEPEMAVLLVEDEDALAELLHHLLRRLNVRVLHAIDGAQALQLFTAHRANIALAFVDCHLPDISGADLCEVLRGERPDLPLLLTSGRDQRVLEKTFATTGPCSFLPKPYMPAEVVRRVSALLPAVRRGG